MLVLMVLALVAVPLALAGWLLSWYVLDTDRRRYAKSSVVVEMPVRRRR